MCLFVWKQRLEEPEEERLKEYKYIVREEEVPLADKNSSEPKDAAALDDAEGELFVS